jgi:PAS domain S-box-containing protein
VTSDGIVTDLTEREQATARLEESEERYRSLFDHSPDGVLSLDLDGRILSLNPACAAIAGYTPQELIGQSLTPLVVPEDLRRVLAGFEAAKGGASAHLEASIRHRKGHTVHLAVTSIPIVVRGRVVGVFGIAQDRTERLTLEQQLRQSQKMEAIGKLAGGVAHDFNNLLQVIQGYGAFMEANLPPDSPFIGDLAEVLKASDRAATLTRQLLAFSRQQVLQPRALDLNATVSSVATMLRRVIGEDIRIETSLAPAIWRVHADASQLEQVLMHLAVNSRDAMPSGGTIRLSTQNAVVESVSPTRPGLVPGEYATLVVDDTGVGIDPAVLPKIFEPFFTTKEVGKGTGLGLATVYGIVKQSEGYVYVDSEPGKGTRFTILLPRQNVDGADATVRSATPTVPRGSETLLVVEDEASVRMVIRRQLESLGYRVREAANGRDALAIAEELGDALDLVITDMVMPVLGGREFVSQLTERLPGVRTMYISGYTDDQVLRRGLEQSGAPFLEKPFTLERLATVVRQALSAVPSRSRSA